MTNKLSTSIMFDGIYYFVISKITKLWTQLNEPQI